MVEHQFSKLRAAVRFRYPAPMSQKGEFESTLTQYECAISYHPFGHEPEPVFQFAVPPVVYTVPKDYTVDPLVAAEEAREMVGEKSACIFIPGTKFDARGTRHGRGGGWYDRFLAAVPRDWLRVGVCTYKEFSREPLTRESWDEPVDRVGVSCNSGWRFINTHARCATSS